MKTILLCCLIITLGFCSCSKTKSPNIEGAWKLVQYLSLKGDSVIVEFPGKSNMDMTKIWSGNHFMCIGRNKVDTTVPDMYGVGTFKLDGTRYEENVKILAYKPWEGKTIKMTLEIKNDTLIQTYPVDDNGQMDKNWAWIEKYVRIRK